MPNQDQQHALDMHNQARAEVGCPPLQWDLDCEQKAWETVQRLATTGVMAHSNPSQLRADDQGENLYMCYGSYVASWPMSEATASWLDEKQYYRGGTLSQNPNWSAFGHYTQAVWRKTTHLGISMVTWGGKTYVVARYWPRGNNSNELPY